MTERTVIVTGGAGYVGSHVTLALTDSGYAVVVLDDLSTGFARLVPAAARLVRGDAGDAALVAELVRETGAEALVHLAGSVVVAESLADPARYWRNNAAMSLALFEAAFRAGVRRILYSSTAAVYSEAGTGPVSEAASIMPASPYGRSKLAAEVMLRDVAAAMGARFAILRYFNVAGADPAGRAGQLSSASGHLIKVACEVAAGRRPVLQVFGDDYPTRDGTCVRDYIHVSDLAELHVLALRRLADGGESFTANCGYGEGATVREVVASLERVTGRPLPTAIAPRRPGDAPAVVADSAYIRTLLDWRPRHASLEAILESAWAWEEARQGARPREA